MWLKNQQVQKWLSGTIFERMIIGMTSQAQLMFLGGHKKRETVDLIAKIRRERRSLITAFEAFVLHSVASAQGRMPGAIAEVGVYEGGSARLIREATGDREMHLFDTFAGLPKNTDVDGDVHQANVYACSLESVQKYLSAYSNIHFHQGLFPASAHDLDPNLRFSLVHFDVDLYESTRACLEFFYPRMLPGGIMLSHDYSILAGVKQAFTEFLADKPEGAIELPTTQCFVIKGAPA